MGLSTFTLVHILISLAGILSGLVALGGWIAGRDSAKLTAFFLVTTLATSVTGFFFPFEGFRPAHGVGILSILLLSPALYALYGARLAGSWRRVFVITATVSLYLNFFVLVAQLFQKTPALMALAPTQTEPPFAVAQTLVLAAFIWLGIAAGRGFKLVVLPPK